MADYRGQAVGPGAAKVAHRRAKNGQELPVISLASISFLGLFALIRAPVSR